MSSRTKEGQKARQAALGSHGRAPDRTFTRTLRTSICALGLCGLALGAAAAATDTSRRTPAEAAARRLAEYAPGVQIAVFRHGRLIDHGEAGWMDMERGVAVDRNTIFPVYSVAKAWTTVAMARLAERGAFDPQTRVSTWVPRFRAEGGDPTAMQLVMHQGGVRHYRDDQEAVVPRACPSVAEALELFADDPLVFEPGAETRYSSWGFVLLSAVLESAAEVPFDELLQAEVLEPASMTSTRSASRSLIHATASYHRSDEASAFERIEIDPSCKWGAGGYYATATDVAGFYAALFKGRLVSEPMVQRIVRPDALGGYRFGGRSAGGSALVLGDAENGVVVAMVANAQLSGPEVDSLLAAALEAHAP